VAVYSELNVIIPQLLILNKPLFSLEKIKVYLKLKSHGLSVSKYSLVINGIN